ncbi:hypothetical protein ACFU5Y_05995 [Streptomyces gardneri]|uniref:hypothetical protein n=1 Tax=Streptomyces gardneri TaxID=66892 RepID=UPI0036749ECC
MLNIDLDLDCLYELATSRSRVYVTQTRTFPEVTCGRLFRKVMIENVGKSVFPNFAPQVEAVLRNSKVLLLTKGDNRIADKLFES